LKESPRILQFLLLVSIVLAKFGPESLHFPIESHPIDEFLANRFGHRSNREVTLFKIHRDIMTPDRLQAQIQDQILPSIDLLEFSSETRNPSETLPVDLVLSLPVRTL
jgi:hypothetical protein